jgi:hypothetical protein
MARKEFGPLRNAVIAHRDPNALLQYQAICDLDTDKVFRISGEFYAAVRQFLDMLPKLMSQAGNMPALLLQWIDAEGRKS